MIIVLLWNCFMGLCDYLIGCYSYKDDIICEWLINYEGGAIRRGLTGQILYWLYQIHPYPVADAIVCIFFFGVIFLVILLVRMFINRGWSLFLLPFPAFLYTFFGYRFLISRRDAWMLLFAYYFFMLYKKYVNSRSVWLLVWMNLMMVCGMLIYESILFFVFSIVFFHYLWIRCVDNPHHLGTNIVKTIIIWFPSLLMPFVIILCAGSQQMTIDMMQAWLPLFTHYPMGDPFSIEEIYIYDWIGQPLFEHICGVFKEGWLSVTIIGFPRWVFNIYLFFAIYYLITRLNTIDLKLNKIKNFDIVQLSNIVIVQFVLLLPYILFLSDDLARNMTYWTISSLMFFYFFDTRSYSPDRLTRISMKIQNGIYSNHILSNPYIYIVVLLLLPLEFHGGGVKMILPIIPQELKHIMCSIL